MRKTMMTTALALGLTSGVAIGADLANGAGQTCDGEGTWHFINNQTQGAPDPGTIYVMFTSGNQSIDAMKVNRNTQHFYVSASGMLVDASTDLPGRLVLSDFTCEVKCEKDCK